MGEKLQTRKDMRIKKDTNKDRWPEETGAFAAPGNVSDRVKNVPANLQTLVATQKDESQMNSVPFTRKALQCWGEGTSTQHTLNLDGRVHIVAIKMQVVKRTINAFIFNHVSVYVCTPEWGAGGSQKRGIDPLKLLGTDVGESNSSPPQEQYVF